MENSQVVPETGAHPAPTLVIDSPGLAARQGEVPGINAVVPLPGTAIDQYEATYESARQALAVAKNVPEVKDVLSIAAAMNAYAQKAQDRSLESDAFELRLRAERRLGQMMAAQKRVVGVAKGGGDNRSKQRVSRKPGDLPALKDAGIDKNLAHRARKMAWPSDQKFEEHIRFCRGGNYSVSDSQHFLERYSNKDDLNDAEIRTLSSFGKWKMYEADRQYRECVETNRKAIDELLEKYTKKAEAAVTTLRGEFDEADRAHREAINEIDDEAEAAVAAKQEEFDAAVAVIQKEYDGLRRPHQEGIDDLDNKEKEAVAAIAKEFDDAAGPHREAIKKQEIKRQDALKDARSL